MGETFIFDAGSLYRRNIGQYIVVPYLDDCGIHTIDALVASHNDTDHINGVPEICQHCRVRQIYTNPVFMQQTSQGGAHVLNEFVKEHSKALKVLPCHLVLNGVTIETLWPDPNDETITQLSDNNTSSVILMTYAGRSVLITSDIEQTTQQTLLDRYPNLKIDVLIAPHHGSTATLSPEFLTQLNPKIILSSCSYASYQKKSVVSERFYPADFPRKNIAHFFYTARDGALTVTINPSGNIATSSWLN
jgi:competence protein ComEC